MIIIVRLNDKISRETKNKKHQNRTQCRVDAAGTNTVEFTGDWAEKKK